MSIYKYELFSKFNVNLIILSRLKLLVFLVKEIDRKM